MDWRERIEIDPEIHHGDPRIKDTRVPVSVIVGSIADGGTPQQILDAWPQLTRDDIRAALKFVAEAVNDADFVPLHRGGRPVSARLKVDEDLPRQIGRPADRAWPRSVSP